MDTVTNIADYGYRRDLGIDIIGKVPWGTHIAHLYSSKEDFFGVMAPYIKAGLLHNELCVCIYAQNTDYNEVKCNISRFVRNVDMYIDKGQLKIISYAEWYLSEDGFNELRVGKQWNELVRHALEKGYDGLRSIADTCWLKRSFYRTFSRYEKNVNKIIFKLPFIALCLYDINKVNRAEIKEIVKNHTYVIKRHGGKLLLQRNLEFLIREKQLAESMERYNNLIRLLPVSVFIHNDRRIFYCNDTAMKLIGMEDFTEISNISIPDLVASEERFNVDRFIDKALKDGDKQNCLQCKFVSRDGTTRDVEIVTTGYHYHGDQVLLSVVRDVTPFKIIRELEENIKESRELLNYKLEYDKLKTEFFANISHEFKTPLNVILCALQLLKKQKKQFFSTTKECEYLKIIQQNCFRLLRLVNNLIDLTGIDSGYFDIKPQNHDIVSLAKNITMSVVEYAKNKNLDIAFETNCESKIMACDPDQFERILLNLLSNSIKFTNDGGYIKVSVTDCGEKIRISVKDNGIGIPIYKQKVIFDRFQQADSSLRKRHEGSGIGLSIVKALVEKHNGKIILNSSPGQGSEFIIELPCKVLEGETGDSNLRNDNENHNYTERTSIELSDIYL